MLHLAPPELVPVHSRHHQIEHNGTGPEPLVEPAEAITPIYRRLDSKALELKKRLKRVADVLVVVDDEDCVCESFHTSSFGEIVSLASGIIHLMRESPSSDAWGRQPRSRPQRPDRFFQIQKYRARTGCRRAEGVLYPLRTSRVVALNLRHQSGAVTTAPGQCVLLKTAR